MTSYTCNWQELVNPHTLKKYYYNSKTKVVSYLKPKEYELYVAKLKIEMNVKMLKKNNEKKSKIETINRDKDNNSPQNKLPKLVDYGLEDFDSDSSQNRSPLNSDISEIIGELNTIHRIIYGFSDRLSKSPSKVASSMTHIAHDLDSLYNVVINKSSSQSNDYVDPKEGIDVTDNLQLSHEEKTATISQAVENNDSKLQEATCKGISEVFVERARSVIGKVNQHLETQQISAQNERFISFKTRYEDWQNRKLEDEYFERIFQDFEEFIQNSLQNDCKNQLPI